MVRSNGDEGSRHGRPRSRSRERGGGRRGGEDVGPPRGVDLRDRLSGHPRKEHPLERSRSPRRPKRRAPPPDSPLRRRTSRSPPPLRYDKFVNCNFCFLFCQTSMLRLPKVASIVEYEIYWRVISSEVPKNVQDKSSFQN